jgi:hypothetical protein
VRALLAALCGLALPAGGAGPLATPSRAAAVDETTLAAVRSALTGACSAERSPHAVFNRALGGGEVSPPEALSAPAGLQASRRWLSLHDGRRARVDVHRRAGRLQRVILELSAPVGGVLRPGLWLVTDARCVPRTGRWMRYDARGVATTLHSLDARLQPTSPAQALDSAVPPPLRAARVPVAMVDAGVNYTLQAVARRLARRPDGSLIGYDFWDMDARPFDVHPTRNPFFPQRHGTATASVVMDDSEVASIAPYRYPRPDMSRMADLVAHADDAGIRIVNLSLGGNDAAQWQAFAEAARMRPHMLFIASAGNNGRDIDARPVYPAALDLANLVTVTSAEVSGALARGSNWGARSVDLLVPAETLVGLDFQGFARPLAGSSHAAARVSALAACLLAGNPGWQAEQLREALFALARPPPGGDGTKVRVGLIPTPTARARGACRARPVEPRRRGVLVLEPAEYAAAPAGTPPVRVLVPLQVYLPRGSVRTLDEVTAALAAANDVFGQCGVALGAVSVHLVDLPSRLHYFTYAHARELVQALRPGALSVWLMRDTLERMAFDAQAVGRSNGRRHPSLVGSVWITRHLADLGTGLAHELYHVLADTGQHVPEVDNLMHERSAPGPRRLTGPQCERLLKVSSAFDLLDALPAEAAPAHEREGGESGGGRSRIETGRR